MLGYEYGLMWMTVLVLVLGLVMELVAIALSVEATSHMSEKVVFVSSEHTSFSSLASFSFVSLIETAKYC